jgi:Spondin_N
MNTVTSLFLGLSIAASSAFAQQSVTYEFEFIAEWSASAHPTQFPSNPHFSPVTGATHSDAISLWSPGAIATNGIEVMAETGGTNALRTEVLDHIDDGNADQFLRFGSVPLSPGSTSAQFTVSKDFPLLTLVTMIAPSPDWFVGIHDLNLFQDGVWIEGQTFDLDPYDSGTDSGISYTSSNANTSPHLPIANIADEFPFAGTPRIGTLRITRISNASCSLADVAEPYDQLNFLDVSTYLTSFSSSDPVADINNDGSFNFLDISEFLNLYSAGCP